MLSCSTVSLRRLLSHYLSIDVDMSRRGTKVGSGAKFSKKNRSRTYCSTVSLTKTRGCPLIRVSCPLKTDFTLHVSPLNKHFTAH